jgi:hypothetical protein
MYSQTGSQQAHRSSGLPRIDLIRQNKSIIARRTETGSVAPSLESAGWYVAFSPGLSATF